MHGKERFEALKAAYPERFVGTPWVEDDAFLAPIGIVIPGKYSFPQGLVKAFATDFVVEEVGVDGSVSTVDYAAVHAETISGVYGGTHFATLVKCGISTLEAVKEIERQLGIKPDSVRYAGIKDVNAITAQRISIRGARTEDVVRIVHPRFFLKDVVAGKGALATGELRGNRFTILVRTRQELFAEAPVTALRDRLKYVAERGFYNFYYLQRFSAPRFINHAWGRDIIKGRYEDAVRSILCEQTPNELPFLSDIRKALTELYGDWHRMLELVDESLPETLYVERSMLTHLVSNPDDFVGALGTEPKQVLMWVYAYSSKLMNETLSEYLVTNRALPETLPLVVSTEREDIAMYRTLLDRDGLFPPRWANLRPFPHIRTSHREVRTRSPIQLHDIDLVDEGVRFSFTLGKGEYATTFLAHLFNLVGGINRETDTAFKWNECSMIDPETRAYFAQVLDRTDSVMEDE